MAHSVETIRRTLETFDPTKRSTLVGGAAIIWDLASRDADVSSLPLRDVDVVTPHQHIETLYIQLDPLYRRYAIYNDRKLTINPPNLAQFEAFAENHEYIDPHVRDRSGSPVCVADLVTPENIGHYSGRKYLKLGQTLWWKAMTGREQDIATIQRTLHVLNDQGLATNSEWRQILGALDKDCVRA